VDDLESRFWGNCINTWAEELKQLLYLELMGFPRKPTWRTQYNFDGEDKSYIDIGGGPSSVLLKFENRGYSAVVDPSDWPQWVIDRYDSAGITYYLAGGEDLSFMRPVDVALVYNCLQHCSDPEKIIANARRVSTTLKMFEWIGIPPHEGHPHMLTADALARWTGQKGRIYQLDGRNECYGTAWVI
jgi:SAM-dependent methyltransferase